MTDKQLIKLVTSFRRGILGKQSSALMCFAVCAPLQSYLGFLGYDVKLIEGRFYRSSYENVHAEHYWLELPDGRILDPTADQFKAPDGSLMPTVYIGVRPDEYKSPIT